MNSTELERLAHTEVFYALVMHGPLRTVQDVKDYIKGLGDAQLIFDETSAVRLYISDKSEHMMRSPKRAAK